MNAADPTDGVVYQLIQYLLRIIVFFANQIVF